MSKTDSNVIMFPVDHITNPENLGIKTIHLPVTIEETTNFHLRVNEVMEYLLTMLSKEFTNAGFNITSENSLKEGALLIEIIRALLFKQNNIRHPFHELAEKIFELENGNLRLVSKLIIKF